MPNIIVKKYEHYNRAMGKWIGSRKQYEQEMVKGGYVPFDKAEQMVEQAKERNTKKYDGLSEDKMRFLYQVKNLADKDGNIPTTERFVEGLKKHKVISRDLSNLPKHYQGGFNED
jgi:hypothetical protein